MQLSALDLFAGCGGLSYGLKEAGIEIVAACEIDKWAGDTFEYNHNGVHLYREDIRNISCEHWRRQYRGSVDLIVGGPPCQGFSVSGKRQYRQYLEQNSLIEEFVRVVEAVQPECVLIENVAGFKSANLRPGIKVIRYVTDALSALSYNVYVEELQASEFGVPSIRKRIFIFASKRPLVRSPFPSISAISPSSPLSVTTTMAISDLPPIKAREGIDGPQPYATSPKNQFQRQMRRSSHAVHNHVAMKHTDRLVERFSQMKPGESAYRIGRKTHLDREPVTVYKSNNQRLNPDAPSLCITANFQSTYVHPWLDRNLTAREAARLMTFPDHFLFKGKRTQMSSAFLKKYGRENENHLSQYNQIGNSVPPLLAQVIGKTILGAVLGQRVEHSDNSQLSLEFR